MSDSYINIKRIMYKQESDIPHHVTISHTLHREDLLNPIIIPYYYTYILNHIYSETVIEEPPVSVCNMMLFKPLTERSGVSHRLHPDGGAGGDR